MRHIIGMGQFINESYFSDLTPYTYGSRRYDDTCVNVGWLDGRLDYETGDVPVEFLKKLEGVKMANFHKGSHVCELCHQVSGNGVGMIKGKNKSYAFPQMIIHYIRDHNYKPPQEFIDLIMNGA